MVGGTRGGRKAELQTVRAWNTRLVLSTIRAAEQISRYDVSKKTGLNPTTVTKLTDDLIAGGFVREVGKGASSGGRRPILLTIDDTKNFFLTVGVGAHSVSLSVIDFTFKCVETRPIPLSAPVSDKVFGRKLRENLDVVGRRTLLGAAVSVGGVVDSEKGTITHCACLRQSGFPVAELLTETLGVPVIVENGTRVAAWNEYGHRRGIRCLALFLADSGVGAGIVVDGRLFRGAKGFSGEIGHTIIEPDGRTCTMGHRGCLEALTNTNSLLDDLGAASKKKVTLDDIDRLCAESAACRKVVEGKAQILNTALALLVDAVDPDALVLGGGLFQRSEVLFEIARREVLRRSFAGRGSPGPEICRSILSHAEKASGLVRLLWHELLEQDQLRQPRRKGRRRGKRKVRGALWRTH